jgi:hypothetical protein
MPDGFPLHSSAAAASTAHPEHQLSDAAAFDVVERWERAQGDGGVLLALIGTFAVVVVLLGGDWLPVTPAYAAFVAFATWFLAAAHAFVLWGVKRRGFTDACRAAGLDAAAIVELDRRLAAAAAATAGLTVDRRRQVLFRAATHRPIHVPHLDDVD